MGAWRVEVHFEADDEVLQAVAAEAERAALALDAWPGADPDIDQVLAEAAARSMTLERLLEDVVTRRLHRSLSASASHALRIIDPGVRAIRLPSPSDG